MDKQFTFIGIALILTLVVFAAGEISVSPSSATFDATQSQVLTSTVVLSNDNAGENQTFTLPINATFVGGVTTQVLALTYNATSPLNITNGTSVSINISVTAPTTIYNESLVGVVNFTNNVSQSALHTITLNLASKDILNGVLSSDNFRANASGTVTGEVTLSTSLSDFNVTVDLPSITLQGSRQNVSAPIVYNVSSPVTVPVTGSTTFNYTLTVPSGTFNDTYTTSFNFSANNSDTVVLSVNTLVLGIDNATINASATSGVIGKTANASILVSNTGNTDLAVLNFTITDLVDTNNGSFRIAAGNVTLPANFATAFAGTTVPTLNISIPSTTTNGTYQGNITLNYPGLVPVNSTFTLSVSPSTFTLSFSESPVDIGTLDTNESKSKTFSITNTGNDALNNVTLVNTNIPSRFNFSVSDNSTSSLASGASRSFTITLFAPEGETAGDQTLGTIQVRSAELNASVSVKALIEGKLIIDDIDVTVDDSTDNNIVDGSTISKRAKPGDEVEFEVTIRNKFTSSQDIKIEDVFITITIDDIDDGDELEEESQKFDVDANEDETETITFNIPEDAEEDEYDVLIEVEGEDEDGNDHEAVFRTVLRVDRDRHKLIIARSELESNILTCKKNGLLRVVAQNIGSSDEDESVLHVKSSDLGIDFKEQFELDEDIDNSDNTFEKTFNFRVPDSVASGDYPIELRLFYDTDKVIDVETERSKEALAKLKTIEGTIRARILH